MLRAYRTIIRPQRDPSRQAPPRTCPDQPRGGLGARARSRRGAAGMSRRARARRSPIRVAGGSGLAYSDPARESAGEVLIGKRLSACARRGASHVDDAECLRAPGRAPPRRPPRARRPGPRFSQRPLGWLRWDSNGRLCGGGRICPHSTRRHAEGWGESADLRTAGPGRAGPAADLLICPFDLISWAGLSWPFPLVSVVKIPAAARAAQLVGKADKPVPKGNSGPALKHLV